MGRREGALDPDAGPVQRFAFELRELRRRAGGLTYRELAGHVGYSAPALSQAAAGERLPSLPVTLAFVTACGGDPGQWEARWRRAAAAAADKQLASQEDGVSPYRGLAWFESADHDRFFGRDRLVEDLVDMVRDHRFVTLVGSSGSGKSSILRAGLIPRLPHPESSRVITPGAHPLKSFPEPRVDADHDTVVIVDQFEETFTLCQDVREREAFFGILLTALRPESRLRVIVAVRADFYGRCAEHRELAHAVAGAQLLVGPMTRSELREVIVKPAAAHGLIVERALTARLIEEVVDEPGGLPLLSHVLAETWRRRRGRALTLDGYEASGGVHGSLACTAEEAYAGLSPTRAALARRILLRLVMPGQNGPDTRRSIERAELAGASDDVTLVLDRLSRARLITLDGDTVDLAHEALITAWPRLGGWIEQDRERLRFHRRLTDAARAWEELQREPGALYRGVRLALARDWLARDGASDELTAAERTFVEAGIDAEDAEHRATVRGHRRLRVLAAALAVLLVIATATGLLAVEQRRRADHAAQDATSRQLAAQALQLLDSQPGTAMLLATEAFRLAPTAEARSAVISTTAHQAYQGELIGHTDAVSRLTFSPDGRTLASASTDHTVALWDLQRRTRRATLTAGNTSPLRAVAVNANGQILAAGGDDNDIRLWNTNTGMPLATLAGTGPVNDLAFSPDGAVLAAAGADHTVIMWDLFTRQPAARTTGHTAAVRAIAFSPDGTLLATGSADHTIALWDSGTGTRLGTFTGHTQSVDALAFNFDGTQLASAGADRTVRLWDTVHRVPLATLTGHGDQVRAVAFSPDGTTLASAGDDRTVILWDLPRHRSIRARLTGHTKSVYTLAFHPYLPLLASGEENGRIILWDPTSVPFTGHTDTVTAVAFSPDGHTLASASADRTVRLWGLPERTLLAAIPPQPGPLTAVAFSPDGRTLAIGGGSPHQTTDSYDQTLTLWDLTYRTTPTRVAELLGHTDQIRAVAFSPDGRTLASASTDQHIILWDTQHHTRVTDLIVGTAVNGIAFSPDGNVLAALTPYHHTAELWDVRARARIDTLVHSGLPSALALSADGHALATASTNGTVSLWDRRQRTSASLTQADTLDTIAFSPDNRTLATGSVERTIALWDTSSHNLLATLTGHDGPVTAVAFSPDGHTLASASTDRTITLWTTDPNTAITTICHTLNRDLTTEEQTRFLPNMPPHRTCAA